MPWLSEATKDVTSCEKPRGGANSRRWPTRGTETSKYPEEEKTTVIPQVAASERGGAQTEAVEAAAGLKDRDTAQADDNGTRLERRAVERESRVHEIACRHSGILSRAGPEKPCLKLAAPSAKAKYY